MTWMRVGGLLLLATCVGLGAVAQEGPPGVNAWAQYQLGIGARALALGGAYTALAWGDAAAYWNPAALVYSPPMAGGMYTEPFAGGVGGELGYRVQYLGIVGQLEGLGLGAGWFNVHVSGIPYTDGDSGFDYDASAFLAGVATRWPLEEIGELAVGATAKLYRESMLEGRAQGLGWDVGALFSSGRLTLGYCSQDVGTTRYHWRGTGQEPLVVIPWIHRLGVAYRGEKPPINISGEVVLGVDPFPELRAGLEWLPVEGLALRVGARMRRPYAQSPYLPTVSAGAGLSWEALVFDFAFVRTVLTPAEEEVGAFFSDTYVFSLGVRF